MRLLTLPLPCDLLPAGVLRWKESQGQVARVIHSWLNSIQLKKMLLYLSFFLSFFFQESFALCYSLAMQFRLPQCSNQSFSHYSMKRAWSGTLPVPWAQPTGQRAEPPEWQCCPVSPAESASHSARCLLRCSPETWLSFGGTTPSSSPGRRKRDGMWEKRWERWRE